MQEKRTKKEYQAWTQKLAPKSKILKNILLAFLVGGIICAIGEMIINYLLTAGMEKEDASSATTIFMIFIGAFLTGINIYDNIGRFGGAGAAIPVTGFANSVVSPAMEYKKEGYIMGVGSRLFLLAGPVLVYGIVASVVAGFLLYIFTP